MLYTEQNVRENLRTRDGSRVFFLGAADRLTAGARDWLNSQRIPILPASQAKMETYRLLSGGVLTEKPEHMTHLHSDVLVPKSHARIIFRGKLDTLEAEIMLCQLICPAFSAELAQVLELVRQILRCDVLGEPLQIPKLGGLTQEELRQRSHFPQDFYGIPHFMPRHTDGEIILRLNRLRCALRETELAAAQAYLSPDAPPQRPDILQALNRLSSFVYILMLQEKAAIS